MGNYNSFYICLFLYWMEVNVVDVYFGLSDGLFRIVILLDKVFSGNYFFVGLI